MILQASISSIKCNTRMLICNQLYKIQQLIIEKMWSVHHIIGTDVFKEDREEDLDEAWMNSVLQKCLGEIEQDSDFTAEDFCLQAIITIEKKLKTQRVPIIVGGSNSYIQKLVEDPVLMFKYKYDSCFIWIDIEQSFLNRRVDMRVDQMVKAVNFWLVDEVRQIFIRDADYNKGI
uniref:Adenylate isopentenyltransferase n=1 Tax=Solanum lycopersicum TaxID=4081 RepID=A0A3Q7IY51_SOLLC